MAVSTYLLIISGQNASIKRHRVTDCIKKKKTHLYAVYKRVNTELKTQADWKWGDGNRVSIDGNVKKTRVAVLISEKKRF